jgi:hypothetical protein
MAIPFVGFPGEVEGNTINLRCILTGNTLPIADNRTGAQWSMAYLHVPRSFCPGPVQLEAHATSSQYLGIGTPFQISAAAYYAAKTYPVRGLAVVLIWVWFAGIICTCGMTWKIAFPQANALSGGFAGLGLFGLGAFFLYHFSPFYGKIGTSTLGLFIPLCGALIYRRRPDVFRIFFRDHGHKLLLWLLISWSYAALVSAIDNGGGSWSINAAFSPLRWSSDNQLPLMFSEAMYGNSPRSQIQWGAWFASDRPPLLTGLMLLVRFPILVPFEHFVNSELVGTLYMIVAIVALSSWVLPVYRFGETVHLNTGPYLVTAAAMCPFFLFNSVYAWPKLLGASFALFVLLDLHDLSIDRRNRVAMMLAAICAALSMLCHASNAIVFPAIGLIMIRTIWRQGFVSIVLSLAALVAVMLPWQLWQTYVQPHANALIRFGLTGDTNVSNRGRPLLPDILSAYRTLGIRGWIDLKLDGIVIMLGSMTSSVPLSETASYGPSVGFLGNLRIGDFFSVIRGLGVAAIGLLFLPFTRSGSQTPQLPRLAALCGLGGVLLTAIAFLSTPISHSLPYAGIAMMFLAGASALMSSPQWRRTVLVIEGVYCLGIWVIDPLFNALRIESISLIGLVVGVAALLAVSFRAGNPASCSKAICPNG